MKTSILMVFVLVLLATKTHAGLLKKRQGVFGPCQGWGAGCGPRYTSTAIRGGGRGGSVSSSRGSPIGDVSLVPDGSYLFTSGGSWKPIGKRNLPWLVSSGSYWGPLKRKKGERCLFKSRNCGLKVFSVPALY